jgi:flagellar basal-body rod protein FlgF
MDRMLYIAMAGASQTMLAQGVNAHNLANATTTGFREDLLSFTDEGLQGDGFHSRVYTAADRPGVNLQPGSIMATGNELDVAINGPGWIAVRAADGTEGYTRAGDLRVLPTGELVNGAGHAVIGNSGGPIALPPSEKIEIGVDGTITVRPSGQTPAALAIVDRIKLVNPDPAQLEKGLDGLMRLSDGAVAPPDAAVTLVSGALEGSNVNTVDAMVNMIELARQFELQVQLMKTAEENDQSSTQMMNIA